MRALKVLAFSTLFPNNAQPRHGIFLLHRLAHLARVDGIELRMVAPVPWFPFASPMFGRYATYARAARFSEQRGIQVLHPRYPVLPKVGMTIAPTLLAAALLPTLAAVRRQGFDFDVIDAYYLYPDGVAAAILGAVLNRPVLLTAFGTDVTALPNYRGPRAQIGWAIARATTVTTVCRALAARLIELGTEPEKLHVILHGVDQRLFRPPQNRAAERDALGFTRPTLISVGHLVARKGMDLAIAALVDLPGLDLVIAGDGPEGDALRREAIELGVADRVRFLGHVEQERLPALLGAADALLLCSDREGIANVLMEAMSCGTPVVATPIWGSPEVVTVPEAGVLLANRSAEAVVAGVRQLLANRPCREATRHYAERFLWSDTAVRHAALLRTVAAEACPSLAA
jgi:teichuronic acid biosynthesis glycosyltransferase TuaC